MTHSRLRHSSSSWLAAALLCAVAALLPQPAHSAEASRVRVSPKAAPVETHAQVIVEFKADSGLMRALAAGPDAARPQHAEALAQRLGLSLSNGHVLGARTQVIKATGISSQELAARLGAETDVERVEVDQRRRALTAPNDPLYPNGLTTTTPTVGQWYLRAPDSTAVSGINAEAAWAITTGRGSVVVAVLDTGVRPEHPDLAGKLLPGYDFISDAPTANDGDGRDSDPSDPGDAVTAADVGKVSGCTTDDIQNSSWHGTQTAGLIGAATNNGQGMASVGRDIRILPLRVLGKCGGNDSDIQAAMLWAAGMPVDGVAPNPNPAKVINMSLGGPGACTAGYQNIVNALLAINVVVVVSAGNDGLAVGTPANCVGVIAVGGVRHTGTKVGYSDLGPQVTITAPAGNCVNDVQMHPELPCLYPLLTTSNTGTSAPEASTYTTSGANASLGTSFSAPLVSGTLALMYSANSGLTASLAVSALRRSARSFPTTGAPSTVAACMPPTSVAQNTECYCTTSTCGAGLLDAGAAVVAATVTANVSVAVPVAEVGTSVVLDGSASAASEDRTITTYKWTIVSGDASFSTPDNAPAVTLVPNAPGSVTVSLTVTDSKGRTDTTSTVVTSMAASSGGGGALNPAWLLALLAAVMLVWGERRLRRG